MRGKRAWYTFRLWTIRGSEHRVEYLKKKNVFKSIGDNCSIMDRNIPLYSQLIKIGNNVHIASNVKLTVHDITHVVLNNILEDLGSEQKVQEKIGCIEIGDNVFIGSGTRILGNVRIGNNVIIGASSLVLEDVPENSVMGGVPARRIGSFDAFFEKRKSEVLYMGSFPQDENISDELVAQMWSSFENSRK